jgi:hypothetical protein
MDVIALLVWSLAIPAARRLARPAALARLSCCSAPPSGLAVASHVTALLLVPLAAVWVIATTPRHHPGGGLSEWARTALALAAVTLVAAADRAVALAVGMASPDLPHRLPRPSSAELRRPHERAVPRQHPPRLAGAGLLRAGEPAAGHPGTRAAARAARPRSRAARGDSARLARLAAAWLAAAARRRRSRAGALRRRAAPAAGAAGAGAAAAVGHPVAARLDAAAGCARAAVAAGLALVVSLACLAVQIAAIHPYEDAFLNLPARLWLAPEAQHKVELEYWGNSYKEAAAWVLATHRARTRWC